MTAGSHIPPPSDDSAPTEREIAEHLARRGRYAYSRSSGPGGQRRDKVATRVELRISADATDGLPDAISHRLLKGLRLSEHTLILQSERERSRERNRSVVIDELTRRVRAALVGPPPPRRPTRPSRGSVDRRLSSKQRRASTKQLRRRPDPDG